MTPPERKTPPTPLRKLSSGSVVRMHSHNRRSKIADSGATTPGVDLTVNFEDRYLHQAEESPEGSLEGRVKLKFAPATSHDEPAVTTPGVVVPRNKKAGATVVVPARPSTSTAVAPPPNFPERKTPRVQPRPLKKADRSKRGVLPLALVGVLAAGILIPSQLDFGAGFDSNEPLDVTHGQIATKKTEQLDSEAIETAQNVPAAPALSDDPLAALELRVAANLEPELQADASNPKVVLSTDPTPEPEYSAALQELDRLKADPILPPKPQKLAPPSGASKLDFAFSKPVGMPPDPNEMAVVPDNPFDQGPITGVASQITTAEPASPRDVAWVAAALAVGPQTDLPAVASAIAPPPPAKPGPKLLANIPDLPLARVEPNPAKLPVLTAGPAFAWTPSATLGAPGGSGAPFDAPPNVVNTLLVAAIAVVRPDAPVGGSSGIVNPQAPQNLLNVDLRQRFIKPPKETLNSDTEVDAQVAEPASPPPPQLGVGKLKVLSQFWQTQLDLEFDDENGFVRIADGYPSAPEWLVPGLQIAALNGQPLQARAEYLAEVKALCADATTGKAELNLTTDGQSRTLPVTCLRRTALSNGLVLEAKFKRRKWKVFVVEEAINDLSDLRVGDQLVVDYTSDTTLNTPQAVRASITTAREEGARSIELGIIRDGTIETAFLKISGSDE